MFNKTFESIAQLRRASILLVILCCICVCILLILDHQNLIPTNTTIQLSGTIESVSQTIEPGLFSDEIKQTIMVGGNMYTIDGYTTIFKENQFVTFSYIEGNHNIQKIVIQ
ncbi:hypothetical protein PTI45_04497 [Paenibacillus nuruki]|uniref:Uncharacterized protein n=1 Tax=Paenibacillus nuruki TaxID=1886670 RepID=A0A1E3KZ23_9BACL|nr:MULTISPECIES: hypothetical protein [Paenibacillus]ODP26155.1 hypothetical protein PTI45_04497 [Paenibacillus nuruki]TKJ83825.1 hypothetical protein PaeCFBP13512_22150 [Paenibacillus sp. CFBP13512]